LLLIFNHSLLHSAVSGFDVGADVIMGVVDLSHSWCKKIMILVFKGRFLSFEIHFYKYYLPITKVQDLHDKSCMINPA
jgi:hypothetical protein